MSLRFLMRGPLALLVLLPSLAVSQAAIDPAIQSYINSIRAIDDHAHPMRPVAAGAPADTDFDALPLEVSRRSIYRVA